MSEALNPRVGERHRVLVVGTGSVGTRHIRNLLALGAEVSAYSHRGLRQVAGVEAVRVFGTLEEALDNAPDAVVVGNDPDLHIDTALAAARRGAHLFIEKPLSNSLRGVEALAREIDGRQLVVETGFMLRFHPNLTWIKACLERGELGELHYFRAQFGQYLPEWRPGTDYHRSYSARRGVGGVIFDLVHELDIMGWLAGPIAGVTAMTGQTAALGIESESIAQIGVRFASGLLGQVHLDYVRPVYTRTLEIAGSRGVLGWDYSTGMVHLAERDTAPRVVNQVPSGFERNDMFLDYMRYFLRRLTDRSLQVAASFDAGVAALRAALACHQSARTGAIAAPAHIPAEFSAAAAR